MTSDAVPGSAHIKSILGGLPILAGYQPADQVLVAITAPQHDGSRDVLTLVAGPKHFTAPISDNIHQARANIDQTAAVLPPHSRTGMDQLEAFIAVYSDSPHGVNHATAEAWQALIEAGIEPVAAAHLRERGRLYNVRGVDFVYHPVDTSGEWVTQLRARLGAPTDQSRRDLTTLTAATADLDAHAVAQSFLVAANRFLDSPATSLGSAEAVFTLAEQVCQSQAITNQQAGELLFQLADGETVHGLAETLAVSSSADRSIALAKMRQLTAVAMTPDTATGPLTIALAASMLNEAGTQLSVLRSVQQAHSVPMGDLGSQLLHLHSIGATPAEVKTQLAPHAADDLLSTDLLGTDPLAVDPLNPSQPGLGPAPTPPTDPRGPAR